MIRSIRDGAGRWLLLAALALLLGACGGDGTPSPTPVPPTATPSPTPERPAPTPTAVPDPEIAAVVWAGALTPGSNAPAPQVDAYTTDAPAIYAVLRVRHLRAGSVVTAAWTYNDTPLEGATRAATLQADYAAGWLAFDLARDPARPWPAGTYGVIISLDGTEVQRATVQVAEPGRT